MNELSMVVHTIGSFTYHILEEVLFGLYCNMRIVSEERPSNEYK